MTAKKRKPRQGNWRSTGLGPRVESPHGFGPRVGGRFWGRLRGL